MKKQVKPQKEKGAIVSPKMWYWLGLLIISIVFWSVYTKTFDRKPDMNGDNIVYYALGNALAEGKGYTNVIGFTETPHNHFPPGYPFIISIAIRLGAGITGIKMINGWLLYFSCIILYLLFYRMSKNIWLTFTVVLLMSINQYLLRYATIMMSEIPFLFFTSLALLIFSYLMERKKCDIQYYLLLLALSICSVAAFFIRTMGVVLVLAVVCTLITLILIHIWKNRGNTWRFYLRANKPQWLALLVFCAFFMICKTPWDIRNKQHNFESSYMSSLSTQQGGTRIEDMSGWVKRVEKNSVRYVTKELAVALFGKTVDYDKPATGILWLLGIVTLFLIVLGMFQLKKNDLLLLFYIGGSIPILMLWPDIWFGPRFMLSLIPLLLFFFAGGLLKACEWALDVLKIKYKKISLLSLPILLLCLYPNYSLAIENAHQLAKFRDYTTANATPPLAEYLDAIRWFKTNVQDTGRVSTRKPELFYIYSGGRKSASFPYYATPEGIIDYFTDNHIRYVFIDRWFRHAYVTVMPAVQKYPDKFRIIHQIGGTEPNTPPTYVLEFNPAWGYRGDMSDGKRNGQGVYVMQDGRTYTGAFANDMCNGYGVMTDAQGNMLAKGIWKDNTLIKPE